MLRIDGCNLFVAGLIGIISNLITSGYDDNCRCICFISITIDRLYLFGISHGGNNLIGSIDICPRHRERFRSVTNDHRHQNTGKCLYFISFGILCNYLFLQRFDDAILPLKLAGARESNFAAVFFHDENAQGHLFQLHIRSYDILKKQPLRFSAK